MKKSLKEVYLIKRLHCRCLKCNNNFEKDYSCDESVVKFCRRNSTEVRWLPLVGENGYLDLLCKIVKGRSLLDPIDMQTAKLFELELNKILGYDNVEDGYKVDDGIRICPSCHSKEIQVINEKIIKEPELQWLNIRL